MAICSLALKSQSPSKISYQAVIRNSENDLVVKQSIGIQISIMEGSASGTSIYSESQQPTTNSNGLISIEFGSEEGFDTISWTNGPYFIETQVDPNGGSDYSISNTSQLLSVPFALHAKTAEVLTGGITITEADTAKWNELQTLSISNDTIYLTNGGYVKLPSTQPESYEIGDTAFGGTIFYVTPNGQHGLVAANSDLGYGKKLNGESKELLEYYEAVNACSDTSLLDAKARQYTDWRLPSNNELKLMYSQRSLLNIVTSGDNRYYWSSTVFEYMSGTDETDDYRQWRYYINMIDEGYKNAGVVDYKYCSDPSNIRCIRSF